MQEVFALLLLLSVGAVFCQAQQQSCPSKPSSFFDEYEELRKNVELLKSAEEGYKFANALKELSENFAKLLDQQNSLFNIIQVTKGDIVRLEDEQRALSEVVNSTKDQQNALSEFVINSKGEAIFLVAQLQGNVTLISNQVENQQNVISEVVNSTKTDITRLANQVQGQQKALSEIAISTKADTTSLANQLQGNVTRLTKQIQDQQNTLAEIVNGTKIAFSVYRNSPFSVRQAVISFDGVLVNQGGAMNATSGTFIAPVAGIYFFSATSHLVSDSVGNRFSLNLNGVTAASAAHNAFGTAITSSLSQILKLNKGDRVNLVLEANMVWDRAGLYDTQFNGFLLRTM